MEVRRSLRGIEIALAAALAVGAFLAAPESASATVQQELAGNALILKGDAQPDTVKLTVSAGQIAVNEAPTALHASAEANIQVRGGGGADVLDASGLPAGSYRQLVIVGEAGDDTILGGGDSDEFFWSVGDGNDVLRGGSGQFDRLVALGSDTARDEMRLVSDPTAKLEGITPEPFAISLPGRQGEIEEISIALQGGDDSFVASPGLPEMLIQVGGGAGDDTIVGGEDADQLFGGEGSDHISGKAGGDVIFGEAGNDFLGGEEGNDFLSGNEGADRLSQGTGGGPTQGGPGDDEVIWQPGEGDLETLGEEGFDRLVIQGTGAADEIKAFKSGPGTTIEGTGPDSTLTLADGTNEFEELAFLGEGGNDRFTVSPGLGLPVAAAGGDGDDTLLGAEEPDRLSGGSGADEIDGGEGEDSLQARDGEGDVVRGGGSEDTAITDRLTLDTVTEVEHLNTGEDIPPPPIPPSLPPVLDTEALLPRLGGVAVRRVGRKLIAQTRLTCPAAEAGGCRVTLTVEATRPDRGVKVLVGTKIVELQTGEQRRVSIPFLATAAGLAKHGRLPVRIRIESSDAAGNDAARTVALVLRVPPGRRG